VSAGDDPYAERRKLSFEQAEGAAPLPSQLRLKEISLELRAWLWNVIYKHLRDATASKTTSTPRPAVISRQRATTFSSV
jgi:hypothetical protein